jgi:hypothetical protein
MSLPAGIVPVAPELLNRKVNGRVFGPSQWLLDIDGGQIKLAIGSNGPGPIQGYKVHLSPAEAAKLGQGLSRAAFQLGGS